jgi:alanine racemase
MNIETWRQWISGKKVLSTNASVESREPLQVAFDSRLLSSPLFANTLFVAIKGVWHDGHDFIEEAHSAGVRFFLVKEGVALPALPDSDVVAVADVVQAWQSIAFDWRVRWGKPVIAIAGSNGKTTVKEWLASLLAPAVHVHSSPRSYNSQIGVPVSLWDLSKNHTVALIEAGISIPGEMERHAQTIGPDFGVLTHIGTSHLESFENAAHLLEEKLTLFRHCQWVAMPESLSEAKRRLTERGCSVITWGSSEHSHLNINSLPTASGRVIRATWNGVAYDWLLPFSSEIGFRNAMTAALVALQWGVDGNQVGASLVHLQDLDMRMQRLRTRSGACVLSDAYTNDWDALTLALNDLDQLPGPFPKSAIIGPIPGMNQSDPLRLVKLIDSSSIQHLWLIGPTWESKLRGAFPKGLRVAHFSSTEMALAHLQKHPNEFFKQHVLIKGPRVEKFEQFHPLLLQRGHMTQLNLDLEAVAYNLRTFKAHIRQYAGVDTSILAVIKASGYGTNGPAMARLLQFHGVDLMAVACTEEGVELRQHGLSMRILVLNPEPDTFSALLQYRLEPGLHNFDQLDLFSKAVEAAGQTVPWPVHIKIDTGMHRLGFDQPSWPLLRSTLDHNQTLEVKSVFSHLASADDPTQDARTLEQFSSFDLAVNSLGDEHRSFKTHILNTAGLIRFPTFSGDYVRIGIGLFGVRVADIPSTWELRPAIQFTTVISTIHSIAPGEGVGYGMTDISDSLRLVATLPVGYADGFPRHLSHGKGHVAIQGKLAPVVGKVCMDMVMVDVTDIAHAQPGDAVELFGSTISVESFAAAAGTIPYEILTRIPARVHRTQSGN